MAAFRNFRGQVASSFCPFFLFLVLSFLHPAPCKVGVSFWTKRARATLYSRWYTYLEAHELLRTFHSSLALDYWTSEFYRKGKTISILFRPLLFWVSITSSWMTLTNTCGQSHYLRAEFPFLGQMLRITTFIESAEGRGCLWYHEMNLRLSLGHKILETSKLRKLPF